jgi:hypothetical protein
MPLELSQLKRNPQVNEAMSGVSKVVSTTVVKTLKKDWSKVVIGFLYSIFSQYDCIVFMEIKFEFDF